MEDWAKAAAIKRYYSLLTGKVAGYLPSFAKGETSVTVETEYVKWLEQKISFWIDPSDELPEPNEVVIVQTVDGWVTEAIMRFGWDEEKEDVDPTVIYWEDNSDRGLEFHVLYWQHKPTARPVVKVEYQGDEDNLNGLLIIFLGEREIYKKENCIICIPESENNGGVHYCWEDGDDFPSEVKKAVWSFFKDKVFVG